MKTISNAQNGVFTNFSQTKPCFLHFGLVFYCYLLLFVRKLDMVH